MGDRTYGQYCGLARSLDVVGDRWTLLIVRELLVRPRRYSELTAALKGIASNLLVERLRRLERDGVIVRAQASDDVPVYRLTEWGEELRTTIDALIRWSTPLMATGRRPSDNFVPHWLVVALPALLSPRALHPVAVGIEVDNVMLSVRADGEIVTVEEAETDTPSAVVRGTPEAILALAVGVMELDHPTLMIEGDRRDISALFERRTP